jgi:transposase
LTPSPPWATMPLMKPYSEDLRRRIVVAVEGDMPKPQAARLFAVSLSSVKRYCRLAAQREPLAPRKGGGRPPKANATIARLLEEDVGRRPYAAVRERVAFLRGVGGVGLSVSTVRRLLRRLGFSQKNGAWVRASETNS